VESRQLIDRTGTKLLRTVDELQQFGVRVHGNSINFLLIGHTFLQLLPVLKLLPIAFYYFFYINTRVLLLVLILLFLYYRMSASSQEDRDQWIQAIQESIRDNPFHKIIADKKAAIRRRSGGASHSHTRTATTESATPVAETNGDV
jgi:hypothetical protein